MITITFTNRLAIVSKRPVIICFKDGLNWSIAEHLTNGDYAIYNSPLLYEGVEDYDVVKMLVRIVYGSNVNIFHVADYLESCKLVLTTRSAVPNGKGWVQF